MPVAAAPAIVDATRAALWLLLLEPNRVVSLDALIDALWGELPPDTARNTIQVYVSQLRKLLPEGALETAPPGYRLIVDPETIDLLTLFSTQASIALQNARLYSLEEQRRRQLQAINAIAQQSTAVMDLEDLLARVCSVIQLAFEVSHVSLLLRDEGDLVMRAHQVSPAGRQNLGSAATEARAAGVRV